MAVVVVLPGALQADHHDRHRRHGVEGDRLGLGAQRVDEGVVDDFDDHLAGRDRLDHLGADGAGAHLVGEGAHHVECHIGLEQRTAHLAQGFRHILLGQRAAARELVEDAGEAGGKAVEHGQRVISEGLALGVPVEA